MHDFVYQHDVHIKTRLFQLEEIIWNIMKCCVKDWCNLAVGIMMDECFLHVEQLYTMTLAGKPWTAEMSRLGIHDYYWNAEVFVCPNFVTRPFVDTTQQVLEPVKGFPTHEGSNWEHPNLYGLLLRLPRYQCCWTPLLWLETWCSNKNIQKL